MKQKNTDHTEKKQSIQTIPEETQILGLLKKTLDGLNISKELKKSSQRTKYQ